MIHAKTGGRQIGTSRLPEETWSQHAEHCRNCEVDKYPHKARGYCVRCYPIAQRIKVLDSWEQGRPLPREMRHGGNLDDELLARLRRAWVRQYKQRLAQLRFFEDEPQNVDGLDIEHLLDRVATHIRPRVRRARSPFFGYASWIASEFGAAERRALRKLLVDILRGIRWQPRYAAIWGEVYPSISERASRD